MFPWQLSYLNPSIPQRDKASDDYIRKILRGMPKGLLKRCKKIVHFSAPTASCSPVGAPGLPQHSLIPQAELSGFSELGVNVHKAGSEHSRVFSREEAPVESAPGKRSLREDAETLMQEGPRFTHLTLEGSFDVIRTKWTHQPRSPVCNISKE